MDPKDAIKQKINIVELIEEYLELKRSGAGSFKALCPFHGEKTPSFHISEDKQIWHCFGCGEGGDCFSFVMRMEGMSFPEVLRHLGKKVGVEVKRYDSAASNERTRLIEMHELARRFYTKVLLESSKGKDARAYLEKRGITPELIDQFGLGYAPEAWDTLASFLVSKGYQAKEGERGGLLLRKRSGSGHIDRFRNRIMIPLRDQHGNTVGFTARLLSGDDGPKYLNSPETPIYHKGSLLYGLDLAKGPSRPSGKIIVVEGNLDVVASHKADVKYVVASSGTALTKAQLELLARYTKTLVFCFDQDAAGFAAAKKGARIARQLDFDIRAISLDPSLGKDPDEIVQKDPALWQQAIETHVPFMEYVIERARQGKDLTSIDDKKACAKEILPELATLKNPVERDHWIRVVADLLQTDAGAIKASLSPVKKAPKEAPSASAAPKKQVVQDPIVESLLALFLQSHRLRVDIADRLTPESIQDEKLRQLYKEMLVIYHKTQQDSQAQSSFFAQIRDASSFPDQIDQLAIAGEHALSTIATSSVPEHLHRLFASREAKQKTSRRQQLAAEIRQAERAGDHERVASLLSEVNTLR